MSRPTNQAGINLIKEFEGLRSKAYLDPVGVPTIGYGHTRTVTLKDVTSGRRITEAHAEILLKDDMIDAEEAVERYIDVDLNDDQFAALVSFTFNLGAGSLRDSTLRRTLNAGSYASVPGQLNRWVKAGGRTLTGLVRRRKAEGELFNRLSVKGEGRADTGFKKPNRHVNTVFIHCSASDNPAHDDVSIIRSWHTSPPRNWSDIGYHYFIKKDGTIQPGRSLEKSPAAQYPYNKGTIAVCLHGLKEELFTEEQHTSLNFLADDIEAAYEPRKIRFRGHTEVSAKTCPVIPYRKWLGLDSGGYRVNPPAVGEVEEDPTDTIRPIEAGSMPTLGIGARGAPVTTLQRNLKFLGRDELEPDGAFGRVTKNAVKEFQWCKGLERDGVVGSKTWEALRLAVLAKQTVV